LRTFIAIGLIVLVSIILFVGGSFYFLFNTAAGFEWMVKSAWSASRSPVKLPLFKVEKARTNPFQGIDISGLKMNVIVNGEKTQIWAENTGFEASPVNIFETPVFFAENVTIKTRDLSVKNFSVILGSKPKQAVPAGFGSVSAERITLQKKYDLKEISAIITSLDPLILKPVAAHFLKGHLHSEIQFEPKIKKLSVTGNLENADMTQIADFAGKQFQNAKGTFQGAFKVEILENRLSLVEINLESPRGGEMNAELFRIFVDYLPSNADKERISKLIQAKSTVPYEDARLTLKNVSDKSFSGKFIFESKTMNVRLDIELEINFEDADTFRAVSNLMQMMGS